MTKRTRKHMPAEWNYGLDNSQIKEYTRYGYVVVKGCRSDFPCTCISNKDKVLCRYYGDIIVEVRD